MTTHSITPAIMRAVRFSSFCFGFVLLAAASLPSLAAPPKVTEILDNNGFQTLLFALETTGLTSVVDENRVTLFAPTDDVFAETADALGCSDAVDLATRLLQELTTTPWPEPAQRQLERNARITGDYARLQAAQGTPGYEEQLLRFYASLDPARDGYFLDMLEDEFDSHREKALARAQQSFEDARAGWQKYRDKGGIGGVQRLEARISSSFRELAKLLSEAYRDASYGRKLYSLLNADHPEEWDELYTQIAKEVELQRRSLSELAMVLEPSLKQAKLNLIPDLQTNPSPDQPEGGTPASPLRKR